MTQVATVEKILKDGYVQISVPRKSACGHDCGMTGAAIHARARNDGGAQKGDKVVVESSTRAILGVTWLVYMLPVVFFLLGYFLSAGLTEGWRYAIAVAAVVLSFVPIKLYDGYARKKDTLTYTIVREF